jgi:hypothetical protein
VHQACAGGRASRIGEILPKLIAPGGDRAPDSWRFGQQLG